MNKLIEETEWNFPKIKWLDKYMTGHKGFIAGGCFKNIFSDTKVKDIDIFFKNKEDFIKARKYFEDNKEFVFFYKNKKVVAFKDKKTDLIIELIRSKYGTPKQIIEDFDFTIVKFAYYKQITIDGNEEETISYKCLYSDKFFEHLTLKRLVIDDKTPFPINTFDRMFRYAKYGYFPCRETKNKLINEIYDLEELDDVSSSLYDGLD